MISKSAVQCASDIIDVRCSAAFQRLKYFLKGQNSNRISVAAVFELRNVLSSSAPTLLHKSLGIAAQIQRMCSGLFPSLLFLDVKRLSVLISSH